MMHLKLRILFSIVNVIYVIVYRLLLFTRKKSPRIPAPNATNKSLFTLSATTLARMIRQREITCHYVIRAYIERIKEVNSHLNAVIDNRFEDAIVEAKLYDEKLKAAKFDAETLEKEKPLYGVPFTVKECIAIKGCSHTGGSLGRKGMKATENAEIVEALRNAGAIPLCVTNIPEMCTGLHTSNRVYGSTCNPYDSRYTPGGSSGGEGALLGAGASLIGLGSDFAGSIRLPAFFNGVFGFKPTAGVVSTVGHIPTCDDEMFHKYLITGPLIRYAEDLDLIMKVLTGKCDRPLHLDVPVDLKQLRIYYRQSLNNTIGLLPMDPEIKEHISKATKYFGQNGNCVEELPIDWPNIITESSTATYYNIKSIPQVLIDINDPTLQKNSLVELGKSLLGLSQHTLQAIFFTTLFNNQLPFSQSDISYYTKRGEEIREKLINLLGKDGVFIYPTFRCTEILPELILCETLNFSYCSIFNIFGFPAVNVPMGLNRNGLPLGIQVIAAPYQDRLCIAVAKELEIAFGGWVPPYQMSSS